MRLFLAALLLVIVSAGCAKYNTYYNAKKSFDAAEDIRDSHLRANEDPPTPSGKQKQDYDRAIRKAQKLLDEYPGHNLSDDALFLQAKSWHRLEGYRMSIRKLDLLFLNFPQTEYDEEALYLQGLNFLLIGAAARSQEYLDTLQRRYPDSDYRAEVLKVSGDNAFALENWTEAATAYRAYLDQDATLAEADRVGLRLAECHWEMDQFSDAAAVLQEVSQSAESKELRFRARLLQARVQVRIRDFEVVDFLLRDLDTEAEIYGARAEVRLIEAERLVAEDRPDDAVSLLESMPPDWLKTKEASAAAVGVRTQDMLGYLYLERDEWDRASAAFQTAVRRRSDLDDPDRTRRLADSLKAYEAAAQRLVDASDTDRAGLQLLQANALLFGFDRPALAADLYVEAASDSLAVEEVASRALFGAYLAYRDPLAHPDSAAVFAVQLEERYPDSPQAYEVRHGREGDLLGYLMARRSDEQAEAYAALSDSARAVLATGLVEGTAGALIGVPGISETRRRMVYLQRRDSLVFAPTEDEQAAAARRRDERLAGMQRAAAADTLQFAVPDSVDVEGSAVPGAGAAVQSTAGDEAAPGAGESESTAAATGQDDTAGTDRDDTGKGDEEDDEEEQQEEKKKDDDHDLW